MIHEIDAWSDMKKHGYTRPTSGFVPIHMPKNTGAGVVLSAISVVLAFGLVWHIWWLAGLSFVTLIVASIWHTFNYDRDYYIPADEVKTTEDARTRELAQQAL